jgi:hypothetical protein
MDPELDEGQPATTDTITDTPATPEPTLEEAARAAMDEGLATTAGIPAEDAVDGKDPAAKADPIPGTPEAAAVTSKDEADKTKAEPERDEATETEITALGLKGKANDRFREMAGEIKALAPVKEALEKAGIKDVAQLPELAQHANFGRELFKQVQDAGVNAEQYGQLLDYGSVIAKANSGDLKAAEKAYEMVSRELASLAQVLGKEIPGVHDPLAAHTDLQKEVEDGDITRTRALEIAAQRQALKLDEGRRQIESQRSNAQTEHDNGITALNTLGAELAAADPNYAAKQPYLVAALQAIKDAVPPSQWAQAARIAYQRLPNPPAAAAPVAAPPVKPVPGPVRGGGVRPQVMPATDDPMEALNFGIAAAGH